jgi:hypothetical protein
MAVDRSTSEAQEPLQQPALLTESGVTVSNAEPTPAPAQQNQPKPQQSSSKKTSSANSKTKISLEIAETMAQCVLLQGGSVQANILLTSYPFLRRKLEDRKLFGALEHYPEM